MVTKGFPGENVADVHLNERYSAAQQGIPEGDACVPQGRRIDDNPCQVLPGCLLDALNQFMFGVAVLTIE